MANEVIALPFSFNAFGKVSTTTDDRVIWKHSVLLVLMTRFGERVMRPDFGTEIGNTLFENEATSIEMLNRTIVIAFNTWLNSLKLIQVNPVFDPSSGSLEISVSYSLPSGQTDEVTLKTALFNRSGDIIQEISNG